MSDSWIDQDEWESLVGKFSKQRVPSKKRTRSGDPPQSSDQSDVISDRKESSSSDSETQPEEPAEGWITDEVLEESSDLEESSNLADFTSRLLQEDEAPEDVEALESELSEEVVSVREEDSASLEHDDSLEEGGAKEAPETESCEVLQRKKEEEAFTSEVEEPVDIDATSVPKETDGSEEPQETLEELESEPDFKPEEEVVLALKEEEAVAESEVEEPVNLDEASVPEEDPRIEETAEEPFEEVVERLENEAEEILDSEQEEMPPLEGEGLADFERTPDQEEDSRSEGQENAPEEEILHEGAEIPDENAVESQEVAVESHEVDAHPPEEEVPLEPTQPVQADPVGETRNVPYDTILTNGTLIGTKGLLVSFGNVDAAENIPQMVETVAPVAEEPSTSAEVEDHSNEIPSVSESSSESGVPESFDQEDREEEAGGHDPEAEGAAYDGESGEVTTIPGLEISSPLLGEKLGLPIEEVGEAEFVHEEKEDADSSESIELISGVEEEAPAQEADERVTDITISEPSGREVPFLSDMTEVPNAESEEVRAVQSLAGARKVAEANALIRSRPDEEQIESEGLNENVSAEIPEKKGSELAWLEGAGEPGYEDDSADTLPLDSVSLNERLIGFVSALEERIQVSDLSIMDRDGFPLFGDGHNVVKPAWASNLEAIGEAGSAFQYTSDGESWICHIFAEPPAGNFHLRFKTTAPVESFESKLLAKRLAQAIEPSESLG